MVIIMGGDTDGDREEEWREFEHRYCHARGFIEVCMMGIMEPWQVNHAGVQRLVSNEQNSGNQKLISGASQELELLLLSLLWWWWSDWVYT